MQLLEIKIPEIRQGVMKADFSASPRSYRFSDKRCNQPAMA
jgi:hypothetical protein